VLTAPKINASRLGLKFDGSLDYDEWLAIAPQIGELAQSVGFVVGDWLVYGQDHFVSASQGKMPTAIVDDAVRITGIDRSTLLNYAYVSRKIPIRSRTATLSWEHHKVVAKLPPVEQREWLDAAAQSVSAGNPVSTRALRRSINSGRMLEPEETRQPETDKSIDNHIPWVNRLVGWWSRVKSSGWLDRATTSQRAALKRDLEPIVTIYSEL
jgi:hypothetical protein